MSHNFVPIQWNSQKFGYDLIVLAAIIIYMFCFVAIGLMTQAADPVIIVIRGLGTCAIVLLHIILMIGPLARLTDRFKPLLYNRRHLGVMTALIALAHAGLALMWYHGSGIVNPIASAIGGYGNYGVPIEFPFESLGLLALFILLVMAATSHDFWLSWLTPPVWKTLHMGVYLAYAFLVGHVALGTVQFDKGNGLFIALASGAAIISSLHVLAIVKSRRINRVRSADGLWINVGKPQSIPMDRAVTVTPKDGERIAVFRHAKGFSAIQAVCSHQNGPLGEGCIINGLITCPWHGFQFDPETGAAPAPFEDKVQTHNLKFEDGLIWVSATPNDHGIEVAALEIDGVG